MFHRFPPEYIKLHLNETNLGRGTISLCECLRGGERGGEREGGRERVGREGWERERGGGERGGEREGGREGGGERAREWGRE